MREERRCRRTSNWRPVTVTHADGVSQTAYSYAGNTVTVTDPAGKWKTYERDAFGNVVKTTEPNPAGGSWDTVFSYNLLNAMTQVVMTRGAVTQTRSWVYDMSTLRLSSDTQPETGTTSYGYNADGTLGNGRIQRIFYDSYGRPTTMSSFQATNPLVGDDCAVVNYYYDDDAHNAIGRLWKTVSGTTGCATMPYQHVEEMTYSDSGNLTQKKAYFQGSGWTSEAVETNYGRNNEGQVTTMSVRHGNTTDASYTYTYDSMARLAGMSGDAAVSNVTYNAAGQILTMTHSGLQETRQYNVMQQMTRLTIAGQMDLEYRFPASGNNGQIRRQRYPSLCAQMSGTPRLQLLTRAKHAY